MPAGGAGGAQGLSGQHSGAKKMNGKAKGKHAAANAARRAEKPIAASQHAAKWRQKRKKQHAASVNEHMHSVQQAGIKKRSSSNKKKT